MQGVWLFIDRCWARAMGRAWKAPRQSGSLDLTQARQEIGIADKGLEAQRTKKGPPIYLRFPPGQEGKRKRALLGLDDDES